MVSRRIMPRSATTQVVRSPKRSCSRSANRSRAVTSAVFPSQIYERTGSLSPSSTMPTTGCLHWGRKSLPVLAVPAQRRPAPAVGAERSGVEEHHVKVGLPIPTLREQLSVDPVLRAARTELLLPRVLPRQRRLEPGHRPVDLVSYAAIKLRFSPRSPHNSQCLVT